MLTATDRWRRDHRILEMYLGGARVVNIARAFGISRQRVYQIIRKMRYA